MSGVGARQRCQAGPLGRPPEVVTRGGTAVGVPGRLVGVLPLADVGQHGPEPLVVDDGRPVDLAQLVEDPERQVATLVADGGAPLPGGYDPGPPAGGGARPVAP